MCIYFPFTQDPAKFCICDQWIADAVSGSCTLSFQPSALTSVWALTGGRFNGLWVHQSVHCNPLRITSLSTKVADGTYSLFIHRAQRMNDPVVQVEHRTAAPILYVTMAEGERNLRLLSHGRGWGRQVLEHVTCYTLNTGVTCSLMHGGAINN